MNTIFRKVSADERTPNKTGLYHTNKGMINYFHGLKKFEHDPHIDYWLEEIELPTDEELEKVMPTTGDFPIEIKIDNGFRQQGAILMRGRVLAVTAKDNVL